MNRDRGIRALAPNDTFVDMLNCRMKINKAAER
jgi:hypothetical protein